MIFSCLCCCHSSEKLFFHLYQQNKSSKFKVKLRQASNCCKTILAAAAKLHMLLKQKNPSPPRNLVLRTFGKLQTVFSIKVNLLYLLYSMFHRCCLLLLIKQNCLLKTFFSNLDNSHISLPVFLLELI